VTLTQLEAFLAASSNQTFTGAAKQLGMTQPAMSDLIRRLETELGAKLFQRSGRRLVLTQAGEQLLPHAAQAVRSAAHGSEAVKALSSLAGGTATFGLLRNAGYYFGTDLAKRFRQLYPKVHIRLVGQNSAETVNDVLEGSLEAGMVTLPLEDERLQIVPLARDEVVYVTASNERAQTPPSIADICKAPLVLYDAHYASTDPARRQLNQRANLSGLIIDPEIEVEYLSTALSLVADGFGDTIAPRAAIASEVAPRGLNYVSMADPMFDTLALIKRRGEFLSAPTRELARLAHSALVAYQGSSAGTAELLPNTHATVQAFLG
jgi:DNA-binding transcriptional LysR family regulator